MTSLQRSKNNFLMVMSLFGVLVVGGAAIVLSNNSAVKFKSGASNVDENLSDKLVKRGTSAFSPCKDLDIKYTYALLGTGEKMMKGSPEPKRTGKPTVRATANPENMPNSCTALVVQASLAEPFVGKRVSVTGTFQGGVFFATKISDANMPSDNSLENGKPSMSPKPRPSFVPVSTSSSGKGKEFILPPPQN